MPFKPKHFSCWGRPLFTDKSQGVLCMGQALEVWQQAGPGWLLLQDLTRPCGNILQAQRPANRGVSKLCRASLRCTGQLEEPHPSWAAVGPSTDHSQVTTSLAEDPQCPDTTGESLRKVWCVGNYNISTGLRRIFLFWNEVRSCSKYISRILLINVKELQLGLSCEHLWRLKVFFCMCLLWMEY